MLGYGCSSDEPMDMYGTPVQMYGVPATSYVIEGTVTDEAGTPVNGISVTVNEYSEYGGGTYWTVDSAGTAADGKFAVRDYMADMPNSKRVIVFKDVDNEANGGEFLPDTLMLKDLELTKTAEGQSEYDLGKYALPSNVKLKKNNEGDTPDP